LEEGIGMTRFPRSSGVLLHLTSLPGDYGVGDLGDSAYRFVDFLCQAGQQIWQILPLGPTIQCNSPYSCYSAFAGNPLLISPELLTKEDLLGQQDLRSLPQSGFSSQADYEAATKIKRRMLELAYKRFRTSGSCMISDDYEAFCTVQQWWLSDFALFAALLRRFGHDGWSNWDVGLATRDRLTMNRYRKELEYEIQLQQFAQYLFFKQWHQLRDYANRRGIRLFGDMPIFVSHGSADVWANQQLFNLDQHGRPNVVAGVPPDYFSESGQLWGNPLYRWDRLAQSDYRWWIQRIRSAFQLYDMLRIDHFRGFEAYWEVPADARTAVSGRWVKGPGRQLFESVQRVLGQLPIVAEDLGLITDEVHQLREEYDFPGMRVLQFGFDSVEDTFHRPESFPINSVAYTGTHDNETIVGWYQGRQKSKVESTKTDVLDQYLSADTEENSVHWQLITMLLNSASHTAIVPMQDLLGLGNQARMNMPGLAHGNWGWRMHADQMSDQLAQSLRVVTECSSRLQSDEITVSTASSH
jgi:4-alpha-glucanotransferase